MQTIERSSRNVSGISMRRKDTAGLTVVERDPEVSNAGDTHAASLRRSVSAAQFQGSSAARSVIL